MHILPLLALLACGEPPNAAKPAPMPSPEPAAADPHRDHWVQRTDLELDAELRATCEASVADGKPVLLEFSAPWCVDCRRLIELSKEEALAAKLSEYHRLTVDVGKWDRHKPLTEAFAVSALAWWVVLQPTDCSAPPPSWSRLREGGFEPASTSSGPRTAADVLAWLEGP